MHILTSASGVNISDLNLTLSFPFCDYDVGILRLAGLVI